MSPAGPWKTTIEVPWFFFTQSSHHRGAWARILAHRSLYFPLDSEMDPRARIGLPVLSKVQSENMPTGPKSIAQPLWVQALDGDSG